MNLRKRSALGGLVAGCVLGTVTAVSVVGADEAPVAPDRPAVAPAHPQVGALDRARTAADRLPERVAASLASLAEGGVNADVAKSVRAGGRGSRSLYLTPADVGVCVSYVDTAGEGFATDTCVPNDVIADQDGTLGGGMVMSGCTASKPGDEPVCERAVRYGVVPDGVGAVALANDPGVRAAVVNNTYMLEVPAEAAGVPIDVE